MPPSSCPDPLSSPCLPLIEPWASPTEQFVTVLPLTGPVARSFVERQVFLWTPSTTRIFQASVLSETVPRAHLWSTMHVCAPFQRHRNVCGAPDDITLQLTLGFLTRPYEDLDELHSHRQGEVYSIISLPPLWLRPLTGNSPMAELGSIRHLFHFGNNIKNSGVSFLNNLGAPGSPVISRSSLPQKHNRLVFIFSLRSHLHTAFRSHGDKESPGRSFPIEPHQWQKGVVSRISHP